MISYKSINRIILRKSQNFLYQNKYNFWEISKKCDDSNGNKKNDNKIVPLTGENSPHISPLIILPTSRRPIFPGYISPITIKDEATTEALFNNLDNSYVGVYMISDNTMKSENIPNITDISQLHKVGTFCQIQKLMKTENGGSHAMLLGIRRINLDSINSYGPPLIANVTHWKKLVFNTESPVIKAYSNEIISTARELIKFNPLLQEQLNHLASKIDLSDPYKLADFAISITTSDGIELQKFLESTDAEERLALSLELLTKEKELFQLKNIKKELGIKKDDKEDVLSKFKEKLKKYNIENNEKYKDTYKTINDEIKKLESLEKNSTEFNVVRNYLDWLLNIPWNIYSEDIKSTNKAELVNNYKNIGIIFNNIPILSILF